MKGNFPINFKRKIFNTCVLPVLIYSAETWSLLNKQEERLRVTQRSMERSMLGKSRRDRIRNEWIREKTGVMDVIEQVKRRKWKWAGHVARMSDDRWTIRISEWYPREGKRNRGRQLLRWRDELEKIAGKNWMREAKDRKNWKMLEEAYILQWMKKG